MFKGASVLGAGPRANLNGPFNHVKTFVLTFFFTPENCDRKVKIKT